MVVPVGPSRRYLILLFSACFIVTLIFVVSFRDDGQNTQYLNASTQHQAGPEAVLSDSVLRGHAIAPKLENETAKAELGRAAWKVFHTTLARFPEKPTKDEQTALTSYIRLFQRLYPCGECAEHFGQILDLYPPQVITRNVAAGWGCHVHNEVNKSLDKDLFDCANIGDFYDCGCGDDEITDSGDENGSTLATNSEDEFAGRTALKHKATEVVNDDEKEMVELQREEYQRGG